MSARVRFAALLHDYSDGRDEVSVEGATLGAIMHELDGRFPGLAFRVVDEQGQVRRHMNVFVGEQSVRDLAHPVPAGSEVYIVGALSGG